MMMMMLLMMVIALAGVGLIKRAEWFYRVERCQNWVRCGRFDPSFLAAPLECPARGGGGDI